MWAISCVRLRWNLRLRWKCAVTWRRRHPRSHGSLRHGRRHSREWCIGRHTCREGKYITFTFFVLNVFTTFVLLWVLRFRVTFVLSFKNGKICSSFCDLCMMNELWSHFWCYSYQTSEVLNINLLPDFFKVKFWGCSRAGEVLADMLSTPGDQRKIQSGFKTRNRRHPKAKYKCIGGSTTRLLATKCLWFETSFDEHALFETVCIFDTGQRTPSYFEYMYFIPGFIKLGEEKTSARAIGSICVPV